ncbi:hypothetical protein VNO80_31592 [Phaseolus coccineus]|uniref:DUF8039 domain-containing protein n=1 Tax=Phaseolus coccineus TaxID=3886 RepID=A0AAN9Q9S4_PHACN
MKRLTKKRAAGEKTAVDIDVNTGMASGPNADEFNNYLGVLSHEKLSILINSWDDVSKVDRNMLWEDVLANFEIPNVEPLRSRIISNIGLKFRAFKSRLTTRYIFGELKDESPCERYNFIDEETWLAFKESRLTEEWVHRRKKAQDIALKNLTPHVMSCAGYRKLEQALMVEKEQSKRGSASQDVETGVTSPPSPPTRHDKWKRARIKKSGAPSFEQSGLIIEKIVVTISLLKVIGRLKHSGRVRAVGQGVGIRLYFGAAPRHSSYSPKESKKEMEQRLRKELMDEMRRETEKMRLELRQEISQQLCAEQPIQTLLSPAPKSIKGSCAAPTASGDDIIGQTRQCELLVEGGIIPQVVAIGKVYEDATTLYNVPLSPDAAKVTVERVRVPDARLPLPSEEVTTVAEAFQSFVAWPRHLIRYMQQPLKPRRKPIPKKKQEVPLDDLIASLAIVARQIGRDPLEVPWDDTFFETNPELPLYIYMSDLLEFVAGDQELNINIIQFFMM